MRKEQIDTSEIVNRAMPALKKAATDPNYYQWLQDLKNLQSIVGPGAAPEWAIKMIEMQICLTQGGTPVQCMMKEWGGLPEH
jgi:hypothetical protein